MALDDQSRELLDTIIASALESLEDPSAKAPPDPNEASDDKCDRLIELIRRLVVDEIEEGDAGPKVDARVEAAADDPDSELVKNLAKQIDNNGDFRTELEDRISEEAADEIKPVADQLAALKTKIDHPDKGLDKTVERVAALEAKDTAHDTALAELKTKIDHADTGLNKIVERVGLLEGDTAGLKVKDTQLDSAIKSSAKELKDASEKQFETVDSRLTTIEKVKDNEQFRPSIEKLKKKFLVPAPGP